MQKYAVHFTFTGHPRLATFQTLDGHSWQWDSILVGVAVD